MIDGRPMIELRKLHRNFGATRAVDDVSFEVQRGQVFGYIGPTARARPPACGSCRRSICPRWAMPWSTVSR